MKNSAILLLFSILLFSCSSSDDNNPKLSDYKVYPNSTLQITETDNASNVEVTNGDNLVFEYRFETEGEPEIADDEFTEIVYFELEEGTEDFNISGGDDLETARVYLARYCFCPDTGFYKATSGEITGEKTGNLRWNVEIDLEKTFPASEEVPERSIEVNASGSFSPST